MITINNFSYTYPGQQHPALDDISLRVAAGECICLAGHSGCGKSTLLLALKGLLSEGSQRGSIHCRTSKNTTDHGTDSLGLVFQNAESQILCATVYDEVAFGPENLCLPTDEINRRIVQALNAVDLLSFGNRNVERFSAGQKQRLCIAAVLAMEPAVLLLDEPTSQLDRKGRRDLLTMLRHLKTQGFTIIIAEHTVDPFSDIIDRYYLLDHGRISSCQTSLPDQYRTAGHSGPQPMRRPRSAAQDDKALTAEEVSASYPGGNRILDQVSLRIAQGERLHLFGANGCGKSTLLKTLAGALKPDTGSVTVTGTAVAQAGSQLGVVALLMQNPQRQLFEDTVTDEVAFTLKRLGLPADEISRKVTDALTACEALHLADRLPLTLSFGEQHRVALASVIAPEPRVLLLDEPFAGLDPRQRLRLLDILAGRSTERGTAIVIASHDPLPDPGWADRVITMVQGRLLTTEEVAP
jgi:energy-coupling factor transport system ATP-binding protein